MTAKFSHQLHLLQRLIWILVAKRSDRLVTSNALSVGVLEDEQSGCPSVTQQPPLG
uniref:Uncharacterized protein n=1 Tax=Arion vulgaris TaxID=1028688 RepID=A0A0B7B6J4_9EUPU